MNDGLKDKHRTWIIKLLRFNEKVERAVLFGSRALGTFRPWSDVDIALCGRELTLHDQAQLAALMEALTIPQRIDLILYDQIDNEILKKHIQQDGIELYNKTESKVT